LHGKAADEYLFKFGGKDIVRMLGSRRFVCKSCAVQLGQAETRKNALRLQVKQGYLCNALKQSLLLQELCGSARASQNSQKC
jgi:hypothetical protein